MPALFSAPPWEKLEVYLHFKGINPVGPRLPICTAICANYRHDSMLSGRRKACHSGSGRALWPGLALTSGVGPHHLSGAEC